MKQLNLKTLILFPMFFKERERLSALLLLQIKKKFAVQNITNTLITIKWGVEVVWCILTPINITSTSKIIKIACASVYYKPGSKSKSDLIDHIAEAYTILSTLYEKGLHFIIAGDTNELNLEPNLSLSPSLTQIVNKPTMVLVWFGFNCDSVSK